MNTQSVFLQLLEGKEQIIPVKSSKFNKTYNVIINPSKKQMGKMGHEDSRIRYIINKKKALLYLFPFELLHNDVEKDQDLNLELEEYISGIGLITQGLLDLNFDSARNFKMISKLDWMQRFLV